MRKPILRPWLAPLLFLLPCLHAQSSDPFQTLHISAQLVLLDASVTDRRTGQVIEGLAPGDFALTEDRVPQTLTYLSEDRLPLSIALLFDLTDTVQPVLRPLAHGAREVLAHLRPEDEVAVFAFSSRAELLEPFTRDRTYTTQGIEEAAALYEVNVPTFIHEAVYTATQQTGNAPLPDSRRVEIWLTDGTANDPAGRYDRLARGTPATLHTQAEATAELLRTDVVVSGLIERSALTAGSHHPGETTGDIQRYAELTGGPVLETSSAEVARKLAGLLDALRQRYTLGYRPSDARAAGTLCRLELHLTPAFFSAHPS